MAGAGIDERVLATAVEDVPQGEDGMALKHARAGETHDLTDALAHRGAVTVDRTLHTRRLGFLKHAVVKARLAIMREGTTIGA